VNRRVTVVVVVLVLSMAMLLFASCLALGVRFSRRSALSQETALVTPVRPSPTRASTPTTAPSPTPTARLTLLPTPTALLVATSTPIAYPSAAPSAIPTGVVTLVALDLTEAEVNTIVQKAIAGRSEIPISDVYVALEPGLMVATGSVKVSILSVDLELELTVEAEGGKAVPRIVDIRSGGRPLTGFLRNQVEAMINPYLALWLQTETGIYVEDVVIEEGRLTMTGRHK